MNTYETSNLDQEWVKLVKEAMDIGISKDEIRWYFFKKQQDLQVKIQQQS